MKKIILILSITSLLFSSCMALSNDGSTTVQEKLRTQIKTMLDEMQKEIKAKQIVVVIIDSNTGDVISLADSNSSLNNSAIEYRFEPGSVMNPIIFSLLLDKGVVNPSDMVDGHNGRFKIGNKVVVDQHKFDQMSAENVIVHSSSIGIVQLAQKLNSVEFHNGLKKFGFSQHSIPSPKRLNIEIIKAACSYGYGMRSNLMQLVQAYNIFNNNGKSTIAETSQIIKSSTAEKMKNILIKTVNEGTGKNAKTPDLIIGGKTGTAHTVEKGRYVEKYNTTFVGFANDLKNNKYTVGVLVVKPTNSDFSSKTAVPVFKKTVDIMVKNGYLIPNLMRKN